MDFEVHLKVREQKSCVSGRVLSTGPRETMAEPACGLHVSGLGLGLRWVVCTYCVLIFVGSDLRDFKKGIVA